MTQSNQEPENNQLSEGVAFVAGGTAAGAGVSAAVGGMGLVGGFGGVAIGMAPVAAAGAVVGSAAYGAKKALEEGDATALGAIAGGAVAGAGVSSVVGGMGLAVGGTAVAVTMAPVAVAGAVVGLGAYGLSRLLEQYTDEEKFVEQASAQTQETLVNLRLAVVKAVASQKRTQQQYNQAQIEVKKWEQCTHLAMQKGDKNLADQALLRKKSHTEKAKALKLQIEQQSSQVESLKSQLMAIEEKVKQASRKKDELKACLETAKVKLQLQSTIERVGASSAMGVFEQVENKILEMEAPSQAVYELDGNELEKQFAMLESSSVDDELATMKAQLLSDSLSEIAILTKNQTLIQQQQKQAQYEINVWHKIAKEAMKQGREDLAREALTRKLSHQQNATNLKSQIEQITAKIKELRKEFGIIERSLAEV